jgi:hypothetical protein
VTVAETVEQWPQHRSLIFERVGLFHTA